MKVILLQNVPKVGKRYDVKEVSPGFARNFLFSKGLAEQATEKAMKHVEGHRAKSEAEQKIHQDLLVKTLNDLAEVKIVLTEKANEKGHLFAQVHKKEIVTAVKEHSGLTISEDLILLEEPIKELGVHMVKAGGRGKEIEFSVDIQAKED